MPPSSARTGPTAGRRASRTIRTGRTIRIGLTTRTGHSTRPGHTFAALAATLAPLVLAACSGGSGGSDGGTAPPTVGATLLAALTGVGLAEVDADTGAVATRTPAGHGGLPSVEALTHRSATNDLFAVDLDPTGSPDAPTGRLVRIDLTDGAIEIVGALGRNDVKNIAWDPLGATLYGTTTGVEELVTIDPVTAAVTVIAPLTEASSSNAVGLDSLTVEEGTGQLFGVELLGSTLYRIDPSDATATPVGDIGSSFVTALAYDTVNDRLLGVASLDEELLAIDPSTAAATSIGTIPGMNPLAVRAATFDSTLFRLFVVDGTDDTLGIVDTSNALYSRVRQLALSSASGMGWRSDGVAIVADRTSGAIARIDPSRTGFETLGWSGFDDLSALTVHPTTDAILAVDGASDALVSIDAATSVGSSIGPIGFASVESLTWNGDGTVLFAVERDARLLLVVDPGTGAGAAVATLPIGTSVVGLTWDAEGDRLLGVRTSTNDLVEIDIVTGGVAPLDTPALPFVRAITAEGSTGNALVLSFTTRELLRVDLSTGVAAGVSGYGFAQRNGLAVDHDTGTIYAFDAVSRELLVVDPVSGIPFTIGYAGFSALGGLAYDTELGVLWAHQNGLYAVDPDTGLGQAVGATGPLTISGLAFDPAGPTLFGVTAGPSPKLVILDRATGDDTIVATVGSTPIEGLCFDPDAGRLFATETSTRTLIEIDPATGARFVVGATAEAIDALGGPFVR